MDSAGGLYFAQARRYDGGVGRFVSEDFIKGHIAVPYTMNHYNYCWNRPMDLVDLNGMWPTAGVTSELFGIHEKAAEMDDSDPVHSVSDWCSKGDNLKSAGELGKYSLDLWVQYATNKNLKNTLKTSQTVEEMAGLVEAMMKKNKEILKFTIGGVFAYMIPCLIGVYMGFYQGADLQFMFQIAGFVTIFIVVGGLIWLFRKQYDSRKLNGYIYLFGSLGLLMEVMFWGNIFGEKRVIVCIVIYIVTFILGILILLLAMRKIIIKNKLIREIGKVVGTVGGFFIIFMVRVGKAFSGRRGEVIFRNMDSDDTMKLMWSCILFLACIYGLICSMNITSLAIED